MNIGTAKPSASELAEVRHHLINSISIHDDYNAGRFETDALECILGIFKSSDYAILCGGSGLYVDLVCNGSDNLPERNPLLRAELTALFEKEGIETLQQKLQRLDPEFYETIDRQNPHRLIRAIEVCIQSGKKYSGLRTEKKSKRPFQIIKVGLEDEREVVYKHIDERVERMISANLLKEAQALYEFRNLNALQTVGYTELFEFIEGKIPFADAVRLIKQHTRNYAKRQWTWFRRDKDIEWFKPRDFEKITEYINGSSAG
jgi:tRNA dimethylallyltransferase